jgi:hypothetical protein
MKRIKGAGGSEGGIGHFFIGLIMMIAGGYLFLNNIQVGTNFGGGFSMRLFSIGGVGITSGYVMFPFIFGIGMIFYNARNLLGWLLAIGSLIMLGVGVIANIRFHFVRMTAFELISILVLLIGGVGLFLRSLRNFSKMLDKYEDQ